jgi:hypothetical protein
LEEGKDQCRAEAAQACARGDIHLGKSLGNHAALLGEERKKKTAAPGGGGLAEETDVNSGMPDATR